MTASKFSSSSLTNKSPKNLWDGVAVDPTIGTISNPANNAVELYNKGLRTSGLYYINLPTVGSTQVYCDLTTAGGGWMLAMRIDSTLGTGTVRHYADPSWWNGTGYSAAPATARTNGEVKTAAYVYYPHSEIMLEYGYGASYFASTALATYKQPSSGNPAQINSTLATKQNTNGYHFNGGYTNAGGYTTAQNRWTKTWGNDHTFFANGSLHINVGTDVIGQAASNDSFRFWFNNMPDNHNSGNVCNQVGGFGMSGDFGLSTNPSNDSLAYSSGNASATISPPANWGFAGCNWNTIKANAGTSGLNYAGASATTNIGSSYYSNGVGLIWVR